MQGSSTDEGLCCAAYRFYVSSSSSRSSEGIDWMRFMRVYVYMVETADLFGIHVCKLCQEESE